MPPALIVWKEFSISQTARHAKTAASSNAIIQGHISWNAQQYLILNAANAAWALLIRIMLAQAAKVIMIVHGSATLDMKGPGAC